MSEVQQGMSKEQAQEMVALLEEYDEFVEQFSDRAKAIGLQGPAQLIGVLNVLGMIYRKTADQGFVLTDKDCPLMAFPNHLQMMEERMNAVLKTIATVSIRTIVEKP